MGLIKWLFGMNLSEEDIEHNRRIDEVEKFKTRAYKAGFGNYWGDPKGIKEYKEYLKQNKVEREKFWNDYEQKLANEKHEKLVEVNNIETNAKFKVINMKQKQNIPLSKEDLEFIEKYNDGTINLINNNSNGNETSSNKNSLYPKFCPTHEVIHICESNNNNINTNSNNQHKSKLELELEIKQKELELLKLRAQMEKEKS